MKTHFLLPCIILMLTALSPAEAKDYRLASPDGRTLVTVSAGTTLTWQVSRDGCTVLTPSEMALTIEEGGNTFDVGSKVLSSRTGRRDIIIPTPIYHKSAVHDLCNTLTLKLSDGFAVEFRAYCSGVAYRFSTTRKGDLTVRDETAEFNIDGDRDLFVPYVNDCRAGERWCYSFESYYDEVPFSQTVPDSLATIPLLVSLDGGRKAAIMEAGAEDYPGMFLKRSPSGNMGFTAEFAPYPLETALFRENIIPTRRADYIARTSGERTFPWRVVVISDRDADLADCDLAMILAPECRLEDTSWIRPGKASWEWWSGIHISGVDFEAGVNTATYKYFVDFSAANGLEYVVIDAGWSGRSLMEVRSGLDLQEVVDYASSKGVGIILWALWSSALEQAPEVFPHYARMGVRGFKVDYIDSDDQETVRKMFEMAALAAENRLVLDFHGAKPAGGLHRAYPNVLNFEGVKGLENSRWIDLVDEVPINDIPRYDVTCPFTRMLLGPMDFTPGAMDHATWEKYVGDESNPHVIGTRAHHMAMFAIYEAPLQMLADSPTKFMREQECTDFIAKVPVTYDRTAVLDGRVGEYLIMAREKDGVWYLGALTDRASRDIVIDLCFLGEGDFTADIFADGINADRCQEDYKHTSVRVTSSDRLKVHLAEAGGWTARIERER